jgi:hypothetical protein
MRSTIFGPTRRSAHTRTEVANNPEMRTRVRPELEGD